MQQKARLARAAKGLTRAGGDLTRVWRAQLRHQCVTDQAYGARGGGDACEQQGHAEHEGQDGKAH